MRTTTLKINSATFGCRPVFISQEEYRKDPSLIKWFYTKNENGANQLLTNKREDEHLWAFVEDYIELNPDIIFNEKSEAESSEEEIKKESCRFTAFTAALDLAKCCGQADKPAKVLENAEVFANYLYSGQK